MNFKNLFLLSGTTALLLTTSVLIPLNHNAALADPNDNVPETGVENHHNWNYLGQLNLTDEQKAKIKEIHRSSFEQMKAILTPEQQEQLRTARTEHKRPHLDLTDEQKNQLKAIRENSKSQIQAILTPEQQQKLEELRQQR